MNKIISAITAAVIALPFINTANTQAISFPMKGTLKSESAIVVNLDVNSVVHEKNADTKQSPGPLVNIMTAVVCLENCSNLNEEVTVHEDVYQYLYETEYQSDLRWANILNEDVLTVSDLLYAMMLTSSMEASETIAYHIGDGNTENFVKMMNNKAKEIGLDDTHFTNATGMYDEQQYTTARDMATLTEYALSVPLFETIATTYTYNPSVPNPQNHKSHEEWIWTHSNSMMDPNGNDYYSGAKGIKTANLEMGGRSIVAMASRDGNKYLSVLLKSPLTDADGDTAFYHITDCTDVFNWAFRHFSYQTILASTAEVGELPVSLANGNDYVLARPKEDISLLWYDEIDTATISKDKIKWYQDSLQAPVAKDEPLGKVTLEYSGEELGTVELVAVSDVERSSSKYNIYAAKMFRKSSWFKRALAVSGILCGLYVLICIYSYAVFKRRKKPLKPMYAVPKVDKSSAGKRKPRERK
ncbi:MAG: D-alanyl-D-alanine carboxypeptidase [Ruminococcus sp.]|nr:D-alanyl-D-alanine carboxypeptidase [Ruminococcus sp.]